MTEAGMDVDRFIETHDRVMANSGAEFADIPKLVISNGSIIRLVGDFSANYEHFVTTPGGSRPYYCEGPESDCPLCQVAVKLAITGEPEKQDLAQKIKAKERFYFNVLDRSPAGKAWHSQNKTSYILCQNQKGFNVGSMIFQDFGSIIKMRKQQGQPADPNGYDIQLQKTGSGMQTKYKAQFSGETTPLTEEEKQYKLWPLDQISRITSIAERKSAADWLMGLSPDPHTANASFNPSEYGATAPGGDEGGNLGGMQRTAPAQDKPTPQTSMAPAKAPGKLAPPPQNAAPIQGSKPKLSPQQSFQLATPGRDVDMESHMEVPCPKCGGAMLFSLVDLRDVKCAACGETFEHPNA